ncbi:MAG: D-alanine--D-alanine ligase family protein [Microbacteriaceae bacterium]
MPRQLAKHLSEALSVVEAAPRVRVAVICGGKNTEHDVSLASSNGVIASLVELGHQVLRIVIGKDGIWRTEHTTGFSEVFRELSECAVAFPVIHGMGGEDGTLQGLLEFIGIPYVGCGVASSAVTMSKEIAKVMVAAEGMRVAEGIVLDTAKDYELDALALHYPVFVKASRSGSSYGVSRVESPEALQDAIDIAAAIDPIVLIEREIVGREIDLGLLQMPDGSVQVSEPLEILADPDEPFFTATAKYFSDGTVFEIPADVAGDVRQRLQQAALDAYRILGCSGLARVDFFVPEDGIPVFNELNTMPGMGPVSQFPRMWAQAGLEYRELVGILLASASHKSLAT